MKLRRISTKLTKQRIAFIIAFLIIVFGLAKSGKIQDSFLKYSTSNAYSPKNDVPNAKGLLGKINAYLRFALDSVDIDAQDVFHRYPRLRFVYPIDTTDLATYNDVRLVGYLPLSLQEKEFYHNSQFRKLITMQTIDISEEYFKIYFSNTYNTIDSIVADETKLLTMLDNVSWGGTISFKDPTLDWDSNRKFIICEGIILPLFSATDTLILNEIRTENSVDQLLPENIIKSYWDDPHGLSVTIPRKLNFKIIQIHDTITLSCTDTTYNIIHKGKSNRSTIRLYSNKKNENHFLKLQKDKIEIPIVITSKSPYELGSQVANGAYAGNTIDMKTDYCDLYSRQITKSIRLALHETDSIKNFDLAYDALQAKYYENLFRYSLLPRLKQKFGDTSNTIYNINLTLVDISTGEIVAAPFYNNSFESLEENELLFKENYNLRSSLYEIGSTFKPILAGACVLNYPSLLNYRFDASHFSTIDAVNKIYRVNGFDIRWTMSKPNSYFGICNSMQDFLATSHDGYPLGLTMYSCVHNNDEELYSSLLNDQTIPGNLNTAGNFLHFSNNNLGISAIYETYLCKSLDYVFGLPIFKKTDDNDYFPLAKNFTPPRNLIPEPTSLFGMSAGQLHAFRQLDYNQELRSWILGQGMLDMNLFKLSQAYARLLTKKRINLSYMPQGACSTFICADRELPEHIAYNNTYNNIGDDNEKERIWNNYLNTWATAQSDTRATFREGFTRFNNAISSIDPSSPLRHLQPFFKTGTPTNDTIVLGKNIIRSTIDFRQGKDDALFVMAVTNPTNNIALNNTKGIVMIMHISRRKICKTHDEAKKFIANNGLFGVDVINNFLTTEVIRNIIYFNKARF